MKITITNTKRRPLLWLLSFFVLGFILSSAGYSQSRIRDARNNSAQSSANANKSSSDLSERLKSAFDIRKNAKRFRKGLENFGNSFRGRSNSPSQGQVNNNDNAGSNNNPAPRPEVNQGSNQKNNKPKRQNVPANQGRRFEKGDKRLELDSGLFVDF